MNTLRNTHPNIIDRAYSSATKARTIVDSITGAYCRIIKIDRDDVLVELTNGTQHWINEERLIVA